MRKIIASLVLAIAGSVAADISVGWDSTTGVMPYEGADEYTGYAQLIWTLDYSTDDVADYTNVDGLSSSGTEILLDEYSTAWNWWSTTDYSNYASADYDLGEYDFTDGFLMIRLFDTEIIEEGSYYYEAVYDEALVSYSATVPTTIMDFDATPTLATASIAVIPEPATVMIFGAGLAGLLAYRRRKLC